MPAFVPTKLIHVPDYGQIVGETGTLVTVGPWLSLTANPDNPATPCVRVIDGRPTRISPDWPVAAVVPSHGDAIVNIVNAGFQIRGVQEIETELQT